MARISIEDCLNQMGNRFCLVLVAAHRARQIMDGKEPVIRTKNKEAVTALREVAEGFVVPRAPEHLKLALQKEAAAAAQAEATS